MAVDAGVAAAGTVGVPADLTPLVGRRGDTAYVRRLLSVSRLVTLTGIGGVGKTRLAFRVAASDARAFPDGVHLAELAELRDPDLLPHSVAAGLGLMNWAGHDLLQAVVDFVRDRRLLLVLDNCEHLLDACAFTVEALLRAGPGLRVLATSRQALGITGEQVFSVSPLPTPASGDRPPVRDLLRYPAVALFEQRAAAVLPGFAVTAANAETVADVVRQLDGLPLAIELAAARMRTMTVAEILVRLSDRFALLTRGSRTSVARQRTLWELINWSHALCSAEERLLWARVSVFAGGFDLEAVEAVCAAEDLPARSVVDLVDGLVQKSVLVRQAPTASGGGERARYEMLETVREYGEERLAGSGESEQLRRRHRDYYRSLTARAQEHWFSQEQTGWFTRLRSDHANLRAALEYCLRTPGEAAAGLALATAPRHYWITDGALSEGRYWLSRLLAVEAPDSLVRAPALADHAYLTVLQGNVAEALPLIDEARAAAERHGDASTLAWICHHLAVIATFRSEFDQAAALYQQAITSLGELGDIGRAAECSYKLAVVVGYQGDRRRAYELCAECEAVATEHGEFWIRALALFTRSLLDWRRGQWGGDRGRAVASAQEAVRLMMPFHDWWDIAMCVELVAWGTADEDPHRAATLFGVLCTLWESIGGDLSVTPFMHEAHEEYERQVRARLPAAVFEQARRQGAAMALPQALAYVLGGVPEATAPPAGPLARPDAVLTRREREVADLVAAGLSNKEIAVKLLIAQRTAENHVEHLLAKLGFSSRTQIAVWVHRRGG